MIIYSDINDKGQKVFNKNAISNALDNIIKTKLGEIPFKRDFGSDIEKLLFEPISPVTSIELEMVLLESIKKYLPQLKNIKIYIEEDYENRSYHVKIIGFVDKIGDLYYETTLEQKG